MIGNWSAGSLGEAGAKMVDSNRGRKLSGATKDKIRQAALDRKGYKRR